MYGCRHTWKPITTSSESKLTIWRTLVDRISFPNAFRGSFNAKKRDLWSKACTSSVLLKFLTKSNRSTAMRSWCMRGHLTGSESLSDSSSKEISRGWVCLKHIRIRILQATEDQDGKRSKSLRRQGCRSRTCSGLLGARKTPPAELRAIMVTLVTSDPAPAAAPRTDEIVSLSSLFSELMSVSSVWLFLLRSLLDFTLPSEKNLFNPVSIWTVWLDFLPQMGDSQGTLFCPLLLSFLHYFRELFHKFFFLSPLSTLTV